MSSLLWGSGCASLQHPAETVTQWEVAQVDGRLNHGAGGLDVLDYCQTRRECEERAEDLNAEADEPFALVTSEEVVP